MVEEEGGQPDDLEPTVVERVVQLSNTIEPDDELTIVRWRYDAKLEAFDSEKLESSQAEQPDGINVSTTATLRAGDVLCQNKTKRAVAEERARLTREWKEQGSPSKKVDFSHLPSPHVAWYALSTEGELVYVGENDNTPANHDVEDYLFATRKHRLTLDDLVERARRRNGSTVQT